MLRPAVPVSRSGLLSKVLTALGVLLGGLVFFIMLSFALCLSPVDGTATWGETQVTRGRAASSSAALSRAMSSQAALGQATPGQATAGHVTPGQAIPDQATSGEATSAYATSGRATPGLEGTVVVIGDGTSLRGIASLLESRGIIKSAYAFIAYARLTGQDRRLEAGPYRLSGSMSVPQIVRILREGRVATARFTVPEGLTVREVASLLVSRGLGEEARFQELARALSPGDLLNPSSPAEAGLLQLARACGIDAPGLEGYLFPDTYEVELGSSEEAIIKLMVKEFIRKAAPEYQASPISRRFSLREVVTIASLVEREAKVEAERPVIAAVFYNRLRRGMALESCASIQYLLPRPKPELTMSDLRISSPYNTYLHVGLPPGPIANPGIASIRAALYPADVDYLFFVSNRDGTHTFSRSYASHIKAARRAKTK